MTGLAVPASERGTWETMGSVGPSANEDAGRPHSMVDDAYAMMVGCSLLGLGLVLLKGAGLVTGGVAGLALLLSYVVPLPVGLLFTAINIPFFAFANWTMGWRFAGKAVLVNAVIVLFSSWADSALHLRDVHPLFASVVGGTVIGIGMLVLVRHNAGVGGTGVVTLWLHRTRGWNAGTMQIIVDILVIAVAARVIDTAHLGWSILSAAAISLILVVWHRPGRYIGF